MFGTDRLAEHVTGAGADLIDGVLTSLERFTGGGWEQEDDITIVTLRRTGVAAGPVPAPPIQASFSVPSRPGNEREAMARVADAVAPLSLPPEQLERLRTAVSEAAMNAIEHGNLGREELPIEIEVVAADGVLTVRISDLGRGEPAGEAEVPDLEAKLNGLQKSRGWGLFLIEQMVDELRVHDEPGRHTVELVLHLEGEDDGNG
jgi:anti-sigma regulatory factor (Ser/Thr protein kinase)